MIKCPDCDSVFSVVWNRHWEGQKPEYCPFCGLEFEYSEHVDPNSEE